MSVSRLTEEDAATADVRDVALRSMRASFALSPDAIESIAEQRYAEDRLEDRFAGDDAYLLVAREDDAVTGFVEGHVDGDAGVVDCLHVDPPMRGGGVGTRLFERINEVLTDAGATTIRAYALADDAEGETFYEQFDMVAADEETIDVDGTSHAVDVYAEADDADPDAASADGESMPSGATDPDEIDIPDRVETDEGTFPVDQEEISAGTEGPFLLAHRDEERDDMVGYYCTNCGTLVQTMGTQGGIECEACGNTHRPDEWDSSYL